MTVADEPDGARRGALSPTGAHAAFAPRWPVVFATALTALAGFLDAVGYIELKHLYVSFMSGNSTHLGTALGKGDWLDALAAGVIIASFVAGSFAGTLIGERSVRFLVVAVLECELVLLLLAVALALGGRRHLALLPVAFAMGMQNTLHQVVAGADLGKSFITGALFSLGQSLARWARGRASIVQPAAHLLSWTVFIGGAALGAIVFVATGLAAALGCAAAALAVAVAATSAGLL